LFLRDLGPTEVGGFGISARDDLLLIEDITLVEQLCSAATVKFDDQAVADHIDDYVDQGYAMEQIARIWVHTHPGNSASPSCTDEETFARCFGSTDWAIMFILAQGGETYARMALNTGPGGSLLLPVEIDFSRPFRGSEETEWEEEYISSVYEDCIFEPRLERSDAPGSRGSEEWYDPATGDWMHYPSFDDERLEVAGERF
jgi:proteasome lid subunit RPN8/RPN11